MFEHLCPRTVGMDVRSGHYYSIQGLFLTAKIIFLLQPFGIGRWWRTGVQPWRWERRRSPILANQWFQRQWRGFIVIFSPCVFLLHHSNHYQSLNYHSSHFGASDLDHQLRKISLQREHRRWASQTYRFIGERNEKTTLCGYFQPS